MTGTLPSRTVPARDADEPDEVLVARCLDGDEAAWETVVRRYGGLVLAVARKTGLTDDDAADVFQTVWRIAVQDLDRIREPRYLGRWLARTTHFQAKRLRRHYAITRRVLDRVPVDDHDDELPEDALLALEDRQRVGRALEHLGARCRELLHWLYFVDPAPPYAEIAERMEMRIGSVGPTRARCLKRLEGEIERGRHVEPS